MDIRASKAYINTRIECLRVLTESFKLFYQMNSKINGYKMLLQNSNCQLYNVPVNKVDMTSARFDSYENN